MRAEICGSVICLSGGVDVEGRMALAEIEEGERSEALNLGLAGGKHRMSVCNSMDGCTLHTYRYICT